MDTISEIRHWLRTNRGRWPEIARAADVKHSWILKFMGRHSMKSPGYDKISRLESVMRGETAKKPRAA